MYWVIEHTFCRSGSGSCLSFCGCLLERYIMLNSDWITRALASFLGSTRFAMNGTVLSIWQCGSLFSLLLLLNVSSLFSPWVKNKRMDGHPVFERMFFFSLGIGTFSIVNSVTLILTGKNVRKFAFQFSIPWWFLFNCSCSTLLMFNVNVRLFRVWIV